MGPAPTISVVGRDIVYEGPGLYLGQLPQPSHDLDIDLFRITAKIPTYLPAL